MTNASAQASQLSSRHARRGLIAQRLLAQAPAQVAALDWSALDDAPDWLGLAHDTLATLTRRIGAVLHAPSIRLWIDGARLGAARQAVGEPFLRRLLAEPAGALSPHMLIGTPAIGTAVDVAPVLARAGAAVLLATLTEGPLARVAAVVLGVDEPAEMIAPLAASTIAKAHALAEPAQ